MASPDPQAPPSAEAREYAAGLLRRLATRAVTELDAGRLPLMSGDVVDLVDRAQVADWLDGCGTRVAAGSHL